jgi:hypothetical protein
MSAFDAVTAAFNVRFGSKADIGARPSHVRFTSESGHWNSVAECPLKGPNLFRGATRRRSFGRHAAPKIVKLDFVELCCGLFGSKLVYYRRQALAPG